MRPRAVSLSAVLALLAAAPATAAAEPRRARALLVDANGAPAGSATFVEAPEGVRVNAYLRGLPPGTHAIDLHAVGRCDAPDFRSAGPLLGLAGARRTATGPDGNPADALPAVLVDESGKGVAHGLLQGATLADGPASLLAAQGTAVVVHASADGDRTAPAGSGRDRIACGVVGAGQRSATRAPETEPPPKPAERPAPAPPVRPAAGAGKRARR